MNDKEQKEYERELQWIEENMTQENIDNFFKVIFNNIDDKCKFSYSDEIKEKIKNIMKLNNDNLSLSLKSVQ